MLAVEISLGHFKDLTTLNTVLNTVVIKSELVFMKVPEIKGSDSPIYFRLIF